MLMPNSYLEPSNWLAYNFSSKSYEILVLGTICTNLGFEQKIVRNLYQICIQHFQNTLTANFQADQFAQI